MSRVYSIGLDVSKARAFQIFYMHKYFFLLKTMPLKRSPEMVAVKPPLKDSAQVKEQTMPRGKVFVMQEAVGHFRAAQGVRKPSSRQMV